jgi:spore coat polysaccharide biosynthesis protein SpsF
MNIHEKTIAIVQARMGSTRFLGKVLEDIEGKPMLWQVINRLRHSRLLHNIVVATSVNHQDDTIEEFCKTGSICYFRGSEDDVLGRYYHAATKFEAELIVRVTSDCPLIDPNVVDRVISTYLEGKGNYDYVSNTIKRTYPRGLDTEVFSYKTLERCYKEATRGYEREHVTAYIYEHPDTFKLFNLENNKNLSHLRWTVDEEQDLRLVREIYKRLNKRNLFFMEDILRVLEREPSLTEINRGVEQKSLT